MFGYSNKFQKDNRNLLLNYNFQNKPLLKNSYLPVKTLKFNLRSNKLVNRKVYNVL